MTFIRPRLHLLSLGKIDLTVKKRNLYENPNMHLIIIGTWVKNSLLFSICIRRRVIWHFFDLYRFFLSTFKFVQSLDGRKSVESSKLVCQHLLRQLIEFS